MNTFMKTVWYKTKKLVTKYKYYQDISKKVNDNWSFVGILFLAHLISFLCLNTTLTIVCATGKLVSKVDRHQKSEQIILSVSSITPLNKYWNEVLTSSKSIKLVTHGFIFLTLMMQINISWNLLDGWNIQAKF